jgi:hypothetical protein
VRARRVVVDGAEVRARRPRHANCNEQTQEQPR